MKQDYSQYWQTVVETMEDGLLVVAPDGTIISVNPALERILGYEKASWWGASAPYWAATTATG